MIATIQRGAPLLLVAAGLTFAACSKDRPAADGGLSATDSPVLATVAGSAITAKDLLAEVAHRQAKHQPVPSKEELLQAMIERAALLHRAKDSGLDRNPEVRRALDSLLVGELRQRELQVKLDALEVSEEEMRAAYAERAQSFTTPPRNRLAILHLVGDKSATEAKREALRARMADAREKALATPAPGGRGPAASGFGALAVEFSDDQVSRYRGGDAGWLSPGQPGSRWPAEVLQAGHALAKEAVSEVLEVEGDFFLVMKTDVRPATTTSFEDALPAIRQQLLTAKREATEKAFLAETSRLARVETHPDALARVDLPSTPPPIEQKPPALSGVSP
jgi:peptidyl-prolyl cis-trans isomerase C